MVKIFSDEFKKSVRDLFNVNAEDLNNAKNVAKAAVDDVKSQFDSDHLQKATDKVKAFAKDTMKAAKPVVDKAVDSVKNVVIQDQDDSNIPGSNKAPTSKVMSPHRAELRAKRESTMYEIEKLKKNFEEVYIHRSNDIADMTTSQLSDKHINIQDPVTGKWHVKTKSNTAIDSNALVRRVAKVTVVGGVKKVADGGYNLVIGISRRNPHDEYDRRTGILVALKRAVAGEEYSLDGEMATITVGRFKSPRLKNVFLNIADAIVDEYEFEEYTDSAAITKANTRDEVDYIMKLKDKFYDEGWRDAMASKDADVDEDMLVVDEDMPDVDEDDCDNK